MKKVAEYAEKYVRKACMEYWINKNTHGFRDRCENERVPVIGLKEPGWNKNYKFIDEKYESNVQSDNIVLVCGSILMLRKTDNKDIRTKAYVSVLCKCSGEEYKDITFTSVHISTEHENVHADKEMTGKSIVFHRVIESLCDVALECKMDGAFIYDKERYRQFFGEDNPIGEALAWFWYLCNECIHAEDASAMDLFRGEELKRRLIEKDLVVHRIVRVKNKQRGYIWASITVILVLDESNTTYDRIIFMFSDINDEVIKQKITTEQARRDGLTGIWNRRYTENLIEKRLKNNQKGIFVIFDIDGFKNVNDTFGHIAGDNILIKVTKAVSDAISDKDIFGRIGGDEFVLFLHEPYSGEDVIDKRISAILENVRFTYTENGKNMDIHCSAGVVAVDECTKNTFKSLYRKADKLLYEAKNSGKDMYKLHFEE